MNFKFFHYKAIRRKKKNEIIRVKDLNGTWKNDRMLIEEIFDSYFKNIFKITDN